MIIVFLVVVAIIAVIVAYLFVTPSSVVHTEIVIDAQPERVWAVFADYERYPEWNPYIISMRGEWKVGGKIGILVHHLDGTEAKYQPTIYEVIPNHSLVWGTDGKYPGLLKVRHSFTIVPEGSGSRFIHAEAIGGWKVRGVSITGLKPEYANFNAALKKRVETIN